MISRRHFLNRSAIVSLAPWLPAFLPGSVSATATSNEKILVVIQLSGGNDGLNTVVPFADELYARQRKDLRIPTDRVLKLNNQVGLHPSMRSAMDLFQDGRLTVVQGVGYPNPNRSHFESMSIWHHARLESDGHDGHGWLGRAADARTMATDTDSYWIGSGEIPQALLGRRANAIALENESDLSLTEPSAATSAPDTSSANIESFVSRTIHQSFAAARSLDSRMTTQQSATYPSTELGRQMRLASRLIKLDGDARVYYVSQSGYDTHSGQLPTHAQLLREFSDALKAFLEDMRDAKLDERIVVLVFSEFGRRVQENGSSGTDHGAAGPVFLAGKQVAGGLVGEQPSLTDLDDGDLKMDIDFRRVYATLLDAWLGIDSKLVLGASFEPMALLANR